MKYLSRIFLIFLFFPACSSPDLSQIKEGDLIFHISKSLQSQAIQRATHSKYSHIGIIFFENKNPYVLEATQPVKKTP